MSPTLFIHSDDHFISRMRLEASVHHVEPLFAANLAQGLRVIHNSEIPLSGIYFDPSDSSYSGLKFLEAVLKHRPATPVFLLHSPLDAALLRTNRIRDAFSTAQSFTVLTESLNLERYTLFKDLKRVGAPKGDYPGYITVPLIDFIYETHYPFNLFVETAQKNVSLFAAAGSFIDTEYLLQVAHTSPWLYVSESDIKHFQDNISMTQKTLMDIEHFPHAWKTAEVLFSAKTLLKELKNAGLSDTLVDSTLSTLSDVFHHVSTLSLAVENQALIHFVNQAKQCDKTVASVTLSILMCKDLKFDRSAVLEILGLASLLQDISLYNSPFGDLSQSEFSVLSPDAQAFYMKHPLLSADLASQATSIPDVALQVIRQHHERKDKTGFPNRIGGFQLHPMAEVLSLINSFLDLSDGLHPFLTHSIDEVFEKRLEREVFPHYSERIVSSFKNILKTIESRSKEQKNNIAA